MMVIPKDGEIFLYGERMVNVESAYVDIGSYSQLSLLREYMLMLMRQFNGIGIAAPQVGVFEQVLVFERQDSTVFDMVNPDITRMYGKEIVGFEACLSVPPVGNGCQVPRMEIIEVDYQSVTEPENLNTITLRGQDAVVVQHEIDHLNGTFFFDRVNATARRKVLEQYDQWKKEKQHNAKEHSRLLTACSV